MVGRGTPDVAANAGGNLFYKVPGGDMLGVQDDDGTSAAAPLWAALGAQLNAIFHDQGLPQLGYMNDLLYIAAAIAPASFNDVRIGNNTSSFVLGGPITSDGVQITPTGFGYSAGPGYDLVTGLGTPTACCWPAR
jgi:subtilase family serine protease